LAGCCEDKSCEITALRIKHRRVLQIVLAVNIVMFAVEGVFGWLAHSTSLLADSLDMFGDATVYAMSLYVLARSQRAQGAVALVKGAIMLAFGLGVLVEAAYKTLHPVMPEAATMGVVGALALAANLLCFYLLYTHREDNVNMRSTWLCSRNDLIANTGVLLAAGTSYALASRWPDILVGTLIAALFMSSALQVIRQARMAMQAPETKHASRIELSKVKAARGE
jgi:cation diffusion facilitator family transporter